MVAVRPSALPPPLASAVPRPTGGGTAFGARSPAAIDTMVRARRLCHARKIMDEQGQVTELLAAAREGDGEAMGRVADLLYAELRKLASHVLRRESPHQTYRTTALVNELFLRVAGREPAAFESKTHFMRFAARAMRSVLIDYARARASLKRGGGRDRIPFDDALANVEGHPIDAIAMDDALRKLEAIDARKAEVVELRFFGGLSIAETAKLLDVAPATVERDWSFARLWLYREIEGQGENGREDPAGADT